MGHDQSDVRKKRVAKGNSIAEGKKRDVKVFFDVIDMNTT
jgi:hypothetical protein